MSDDEYINRLNSQFNNADQKGIKEYLFFLYNKIEKNLVGTNILEIGSGAGISSKFLKNKKVLMTDLLPWRKNGIIGNINSENLPFENDFFESAFALDAIHHICDPVKAISELCRVVRPGGKVVIIEPYVSYLSYLVYRIFHNEQTTWNYRINKTRKVKIKNIAEGEQSTMQSIMLNYGLIKSVQKQCGKVISYEWSQFSPFSFFATGGLSKPLPTPACIIRLLIRSEQVLPKYILRHISARQSVVIIVGDYDIFQSNLH